MRSLSDVVKEVKRIDVEEERLVHGQVQKVRKPLYAPVVGTTPVGSTDAKVPVWLCWIALGACGEALLDRKVPADVAVVDAVIPPRFRDCSAPAQLANAPADDDNDDDDPASRLLTRSTTV